MVRFKATYVQKMSPIRMIKHTLTISYTFGFSSSLVGVAVVIVDSLDGAHILQSIVRTKEQTNVVLTRRNSCTGTYPQ